MELDPQSSLAFFTGKLRLLRFSFLGKEASGFVLFNARKSS